MITLNTERGFVKVESWDEVEALPGYCSDLDPKQHSLKDIIGNYNFKDKIPCGLSSCHTPHNRGYVASTTTGKVTNIGNICGNTYFGVNFDQLSAEFDRKVEEHENREIIESFITSVDRRADDISGIRGDLKADALYKNSRKLVDVNKGCFDIILKKIALMVRNRSNAIVVEREATKSEREAIEAVENKTLPDPHYIEDTVGFLRGLEFMYQENDLRDLLILDLTQNLSIISELDIHSATRRDLSYWAKWCNEWDQKVNRAYDIVELGSSLMQQDNLNQLSVFIDNEGALKQHHAFIREICG